MSHADLRTKEQSKAEGYLRKAGYKVGGRVSDEAQDAKMVTAGVHQHERHLHKGEAPTALKLKGGGKVSGEGTKARLDKYARGGRTKSGPSKINIVIATGKDQQPQAVPVPVPHPVPVPTAAPPAGAPPMGAMPPGAMPPGGMPPGMPMRPPMKRGGAVKGQFALTDAGAAGAKGRLEKAEAVSGKDMPFVNVKAHTRRKTGGRV